MVQAFSSEQAVRAARTEEKAIAIATELRKGGEYVAYGQEEGIYGIYKKSFSTAPDTSYLIDLNAPTPTCTCPDFAKHLDFCKHIRGLEIALDMDAQEEAMCREYDEEQAGFDWIDQLIAEADHTDDLLLRHHGIAC